MSIETNLDQGTPIGEGALKFFDEVDSIIEEGVRETDVTPIIGYINTIKLHQQVQSLAMAKVLWKVKLVWEQLEVGDTFRDTVTSSTGLAWQTIKKYMGLWEDVFASDYVPTRFKQRLMGKPIGALLLLPALARDGIAEDEHWQEIANAPDKKTIRDIVRRLRGKVTSSESALVIMIRRDGEIMVSQGESYPESIGMLVATGDLGVKAIERIVERSGIIEQ